MFEKIKGFFEGFSSKKVMTKELSKKIEEYFRNKMDKHRFIAPSSFFENKGHAKIWVSELLENLNSQKDFLESAKPIFVGNGIEEKKIVDYINNITIQRDLIRTYLSLLTFKEQHKMHQFFDSYASFVEKEKKIFFDAFGYELK